MREGELLKKEQKKSTAFETKECKMQYLGAISKNDRMISVCFQRKPFNITIIQVYALNTILYDYTMEVTNRFKGSDLIECLKNYGQKFVTLYRRQ